MITSSTAPRIASVMSRKSEISYEGTPSCVRAWMWIIDPPSSTTRRASAPYSSGVYGIAGHWSRLATAPLIELVITTGSSKRLMWPPCVPLACVGEARGVRGLAGKGGGSSARGAPHGRSYRHHPMPLPRPVDALGRRHLQSADHHGARLARVDDVVDHRVPRGDVGVDDLAELADQLGALGVGVVRVVDLLAQDDVHRALGAHHG